MPKRRSNPRLSVLGITFAVGLATGLAVAPGSARSQEDDFRTRIKDTIESVIYAISSLAVDTEQAAIDIVRLENRINALESRVNDLAQSPDETR